MSNLLDVNRILDQLNLDLGEEDYLEPLTILIKSINKEADLSLQGKIAVEFQIKKHLKVRSQIYKATQESSSDEISKPIFVIGLPRSGTTYLFNLLSLDTDYRSPLFWEMMNPLPIVKEKTLQRSLRIFKSETILFVKDRFIPKLDDLHAIKATSPEECLLIKVFALRSILYYYMANTPSYLEYLHECDKTVSYLWHQRFLKVLEMSNKPNRWLLKDPSHLGNLKEILSIYPDACFIQIHRDPKETVPSICSLTSQVRKGFSSSLNKKELGKKTLDFWGKSKEKNDNQRKSLSNKQIIDVFYEDFIADPFKVVEDIYSNFELVIKEETEDSMKSFINRNKRSREKHIYSLEDYGLDQKEVHNRLQ